MAPRAGRLAAYDEMTAAAQDAPVGQAAPQQEAPTAAFACAARGCTFCGRTAEGLQTHRSQCRGSAESCCDGDLRERNQTAAGRAQLTDRSQAMPAATTSIDKRSARSRAPVVNRRLKLTAVRARRGSDMMLSPLFETLTEPKKSMAGPAGRPTTTALATGPDAAICGTTEDVRTSFLGMCASLQIR